MAESYSANLARRKYVARGFSGRLLDGWRTKEHKIPALKTEGEIAAYNAGVRAMAGLVRAAADKIAIAKPPCRIAKAVNALDEVADAAPMLLLAEPPAQS